MKRILLLLIPVLMALIAFRPSNFFTVTGKITDESGQVLPGIIVKAKGSKTFVTAAYDGTYRITVGSSNDILVFSAAGIEQKEVKIRGRSVINVSLKRMVLVGAEVVVPSYGLKQETNAIGYSRSILKDANLSPALNGYYSDKDEENYNTEGYDNIVENRFLKVTENPLSTFSIDVDAASYSNVRRYLKQGQTPPAGAIRIEEMVNYFNYDYPQPTGEDPFSINTEISDAPWNPNHKLVLIGLQGKKIPVDNLPASNLVFLIDVSGSMQGELKLPLVKSSMKLLVDQLRQDDRVSIVVYAGAAGLVLSPTNGMEKIKIREAIDQLEAGGSTAGGEGIKLAYKTAREHFIKGGNNRVILCTDGDFNVGASSDDEMERLIEEERKSDVFLTVLGYGMGNYKDNKMQKLADKGNGNHAYIDGLAEAKKVLVNEFGGTLFTIAKDVKLQVEFNPAKVAGYRLIGYENRMLAKEDFNNDKKDAGDLGSGHTVTALYEVIPAGVASSFLDRVDTLKYQSRLVPISKTSHSDEILTVKFRYKEPDKDISKLIVQAVKDEKIPIASTSANFQFASSVAEFGLLLRNSEFKSYASFRSVLNRARASLGKDEEGYRNEFVTLVEIVEAKIPKKKPVDEGGSIGSVERKIN